RRRVAVRASLPIGSARSPTSGARWPSSGTASSTCFSAGSCGVAGGPARAPGSDDTGRRRVSRAIAEGHMDDLRYPIGRFTPQDEYSASDISGLIDQLAAAPAEMREAVEGLTPDQLRTPYRDGGWTVAQVVT